MSIDCQSVSGIFKPSKGKGKPLPYLDSTLLQVAGTLRVRSPLRSYHFSVWCTIKPSMGNTVSIAF
nr:MAG TPA: hypothetical protein [Caudoviricetes sp.]